MDNRIFDSVYDVRLDLETLDLRKLMGYSGSAYTRFRHKVCSRIRQYGELMGAIRIVNERLAGGVQGLFVRMTTPEFSHSLEFLKESDMEIIRFDYNMAFSLGMYMDVNGSMNEARTIYDEIRTLFFELDQVWRRYKELKNLDNMVSLINGYEDVFYDLAGKFWCEGKLNFKAYRSLLALFYREYKPKTYC